MNTYRRMIAKLFTLGLLLTTIALNAHAAGGHQPDGITGEVVGTNFESRHIFVGDHATKQRYRVALSARITLLDGSKGVLQDVLLGDGVSVKLDSKTGDIRDLSVIWQH